jgi:Tfp pilus assembly protein PilO
MKVSRLPRGVTLKAISSWPYTVRLCVILLAANGTALGLVWLIVWATVRP